MSVNAQACVVVFKPLEEKQQRNVPAPFEFVAGLAEIFHAIMVMRKENPCAPLSG